MSAPAYMPTPLEAETLKALDEEKEVESAEEKEIMLWAATVRLEEVTVKSAALSYTVLLEIIKWISFWAYTSMLLSVILIHALELPKNTVLQAPI